MNNNNVTYIDPDHTWTTSSGTLNTNLYYKENLHLIEKRKKKLAKAVTTTLNVSSLKQQQNLNKSVSSINKSTRTINRNTNNKKKASSEEELRINQQERQKNPQNTTNNKANNLNTNN